MKTVSRMVKVMGLAPANNGRATKKVKYENLEVRRVTDEEAKRLIASGYGWKYCQKSVWKKHVRDGVVELSTP